MKRYVPGSKWRVLAQGPVAPMQAENLGVFDELVVDRWFHLEQMERDVWWMQVGDLCLDVTVGPDGRAIIVTEVERRPEALYRKDKP